MSGGVPLGRDGEGPRELLDGGDHDGDMSRTTRRQIDASVGGFTACPVILPRQKMMLMVLEHGLEHPSN